nr:sugar nucleotide-binding protein [Candidatus Dadabacteria bacterium]NIS09547.1 sugar nucleotide-binding protein [Candidatus Dadabacteria bacterium]NIV43039.1 sugar nucleotide-binding protein [Candidatus Dadabacteria bacterium]NIY22724.1 sugar nucleotide-binding protein [Candidatus Dadabacteria bacterium]
MGKRLLVIGGSGELGYQVIKHSDSWKSFAAYHSNKLNLKNIESYKLDITDGDKVQKLIKELNPDVVIN